MSGTGTLRRRFTVDGDHRAYKWVALSNTTAGVLMATVNASIVIISLPAIFRGIHSICSHLATSATCCGR